MTDVPLIHRLKRSGEQAVELSIELAPYLNAYVNALMAPVEQKQQAGATYSEHRHDLLESLSALTGGCLADVVDLAMNHSGEAIKNSMAYEILDDSFVEILKNAVDEVIAKYMESPHSERIIHSLKATLLVTIDDNSNPANVSITCADNGRGFTQQLLDQVATPKDRVVYMNNIVSNKLTQANSLADIPLFVGGRGQGLRMLMKKIDQKTSGFADISLSNKKSELGNVQGAILTVTGSKQAIMNDDALPKEIDPGEIRRYYLESLNRCAESSNNSQSTSPTLSIDTDFSDDTDQSTGSPSPGKFT